MKIAVITENGIAISQHFGRAPWYQVFTIVDGEISERELRPKIGHNQFSAEHHHEEHHHDEHNHAAGHGLDPASQDRHARMGEAIADCEVLLCGGMGMGAYESMRRLGIRTVMTDLKDAEQAVRAFLDGTLVDRSDRLH